MGKDNLEKLLVLQAKNGNADSLNTLLEANKNYIYAIAFALLKNKEDAEDAMQQALITVWQSIGSLENTEAFENWLYRITYTRSLNVLKSRKSNEIIMDDDISDIANIENFESELMLPKEYVEQNDLRERLFKIIDSLSAVQRETILLHYFHDKTVGEIAEIMDCSQGTVKSRLYLARNTIKSEIEEQERKSGEKFFGVAIGSVPISKLVTDFMNNNMLMPDKASQILSCAQNAFTSGGNVAESGVAKGAKNLSKKVAKKSISKSVKIAVASVLSVAVVGTGIWTANKILNSEPVNDNTFQKPTISEQATQPSTQITTEKPTEATTQAPTEPDYHEAYLAYRDILIEDKSAINDYDWQYIDDEPRPVVFADVMGDDTPEMIYVYAVDDTSTGGKSLKMRVITYDGSSGVEACIYDMEGYTNRMGGGVFAFQIKGEKELYTYYHMSGMFNNELYCRFNETSGNKLTPEEIIYYEDDNGLGVEMDGRIKGKTVSQEEALAERDKLLNKAETLLLSSSDDTGSNYPESLGITTEDMAMTYSEAIEFLNKFDNTQQSKVDFSVIAGTYRSVNNGMHTERITIDTDGTFRSELSGNSAEYLVSSVCTGRINLLTKENKTKYTFYAADTVLENTPDSIGEKYIDGNRIEVKYYDSTFNTGSKFSLYLKGTDPSDISSMNMEAYKLGVDYTLEPTEWRMIVTSDGSIYVEDIS